MPKTDPSWNAVADVLVNYSTDVQPGDRVMIAMGEIETFPLAQAVYESCIKAGAFPQVQLLSETLRHSVLEHGTAKQHNWLPEIEAQGMSWADVYFGLRGAYDLSMHDEHSRRPRWQPIKTLMGKNLNPALAEYALVPGASAQRGASAASRYRPGND